MGDKSGIEWTDATWNPVTGCSKVSAGCKHCYAERQWPRLSAPGQPYAGRAFTDVQCHPERLDQPLRWRRPRRIFVNSMSDLFHEAVPFDFIADVFAVMSCTTRHTYQILTKRPLRMLEWFRWAEESDLGMGPEAVDPANIWQAWTPWREGKQGGYDNCGPLWPPENVHIGVSVEDQATADERVPLLLATPAAVRWVSVEPMLGPMDLYGGDPDPRLGGVEAGAGVSLTPFWCMGDDLHGPPRPGIDWVVCGGESGPRARPMHPDWVRSLRDQCAVAQVPFLFKQWGEWAPNCLCDTKDARPITKRPEPGKPGVMFRCGKRAAGRLLDGALHDEYPRGDA